MIFNQSGGGAGLNFKVVAYADEASLLADTPAENTIGVITTMPITDYIFSAEEPSSAVEGQVWITVGTSSEAAFSATKKNPVMVYPLSAMQYISGALTDVTAMSYQGGEWVEWWDGVLYDHGDEYEEFSGGWVATCTNVSYIGSNGTTAKNDDNMYVKNYSNQSWSFATLNAIDLTRYKTIKVLCVCSGKASIKIATDFPTSNIIGNIIQNGCTLDAPMELDISSITGKCKIAVADEYVSGVYIYKVWLE